MTRKIFSEKILVLAASFITLSCQKKNTCDSCELNKPPIASLGAYTNTTFPRDSISLDGSSSYDPDGIITGYEWTKIAGPASFTITHPQLEKTRVKNLSLGIYQFELKVTDNKGLSGRDTIAVLVDPPLVIPPREIIYNNLTWIYIPDPQNPGGMEDGICLITPDSASFFSGLVTSDMIVQIKFDSTSNWIQAYSDTDIRFITNSQCMVQYSYHVFSSTLFVYGCPLDRSIIGKRASIRIFY